MKSVRIVVAGLAMALTGMLAFATTAQAVPPNDNLSFAVQLSGSLNVVDGTTVDSTTEALEPAHPGSTSNTSVWYKWTAPATGSVVLNTCVSGSTNVPAIYKDPPSNISELLAGNGNCKISANVTAGTSYYFVVYAPAPGGKSAFRLFARFYNPPANDNFASAETLTGSEASTSGDTGGATKEAGEPDHNGSTNTQTVWYKWTAPASGTASAFVCKSSFDPEMGIYTGSAVNSLTQVAASSCGGQFPVTQGTTYYIAVTPYVSYGTGSFFLKLKLFNPPANDDFANAQVIPAAGGEFDGHNGGATIETDEPYSGSAEATAWYSWTPSASGRALIDACSKDDTYNFTIHAYLGSTVGGLTPYWGSDCRINMDVTAGTTYMLQLGGDDPQDAGDFHLSVSIPTPPANDNLANAIPLTGQSDTRTGVFTGASREPGEVDPTDNDVGSVWYSWTAPSASQVTVDTCGSDYDTFLGLYTGSSFPLTQVSLNDDSGFSECGFRSKITFTPTIGQVYRIAILAYSNSGVGNYTLRIYPGTIQPLMHTLTGAKSGTGSGTVFTLEPGGVNCGSTCSQQTNDGRYVTWTAVADEGSKFIGWKDAPTCPGAVPCVLDTTGNRTVTAVFTDLLHKTLTVSKDGAGSGTVTSAPAGIDCGAACAHAFDTGTMVTLNPNPATGSDFTGWSGACSGTGTCQVTMDDEKSVTATYSLSVSPGKALTLKTGKAKLNWKKGTALLPVTVNQPAKIALTGRNVKKKTVTTKGPKTVKITVAVTGKLKKALKKKRKAVAKLTITAKPSSGATTVVKKTRVTLKLKKKKKRH